MFSLAGEGRAGRKIEDRILRDTLGELGRIGDLISHIRETQLGAARLLYGMGRSGAIPKKFFGAIHARTRIPANNVLFVGVIALVGAFLISYDDGANLLNFGALIAFMGVNLAALTHYYIRGNDRTCLLYTSRPSTKA